MTHPPGNGPSRNPIGEALYRAGLTQRVLLGWAGTHRLSALALHHKALAAKPVTPASAALALFVAGVDISLAQAERVFGGALTELGSTAPSLAEIIGDRVRANVSILPLESGWIVCDRLDAPDEPERLPWPDDSSYHLASAIPATSYERWIDLATGNGFVALARADVARSVLGVDLNPRAISYASLSQTLCDVPSGVPTSTHPTRTFNLREGDIAQTLTTRAPLVTCNAPIVGDPDAAIWRRADRDFFRRLWAGARACVESGGDVVVHCTLDALPIERIDGATRVTDELPGEVAIVVYTPPGIRAYAVMWWSPDNPPRRAVGYRALTAARPHLDPRDRTDVLAGALPPLDAAQV